MDDIAELVAAYGFAVIEVPDGGPEDGPGFHYTVGLTEADLPELIVYSLPSEAAAGLLNHYGHQMLSGGPFADGWADDSLGGSAPRVQLRAVESLRDPLGVAYDRYGESVRVMQVVFTDTNGRWPWEAGADRPHLTPLLFSPPLA